MSYFNLDISRVPFFVCVGTPLNSFDCAGPMLGTKLKEMGFNVFGTMDNPVHAKNIEQHNHIFEGLSKGLLGEIYQVIGIDASVNMSNSYRYKVFDAPLEPGKGLNKSLPPVGEASIHINSMLLYNSFKRLRLVLNINSQSNKEHTAETIDIIARKLSIHYGLWNIRRRDRHTRTARAIEKIVVHDIGLETIAKELGVSIATIHNYVYGKMTARNPNPKSPELTKYIKQVLSTHSGSYKLKNRLALLLQEEH